MSSRKTATKTVKRPPAKPAKYREGLTASNILLDKESRAKIEKLIEVQKQRGAEAGMGEVYVTMASVIRLAIDKLYAELVEGK